MKLTELQKLAGLPVTEAVEARATAVRADKNGFTWEVYLKDAIEYIVNSTYTSNSDRQDYRLELEQDLEQVESWIRNASAEDIGNLNWELIIGPVKPNLNYVSGDEFDGMWLVDQSGDPVE
jgi:hypothetical protein